MAFFVFVFSLCLMTGMAVKLINFYDFRFIKGKNSEGEQMIYAVCGFLCGFLIPSVARKFAKFMPAAFGYAVYRIFAVPARVSWERRRQSTLYLNLLKKFLLRSVMYGLLCGGLFYAAPLCWGGLSGNAALFYIWVLLLLAEIDRRMLLLPDLLTVPLLIAGFVVSAWGIGFVAAADSSLGAAAGYLMPAAVSLLFVWKNKDAFGGGDIKLLAAVGAWLGVEALLYVIIAASFLFAVPALLTRRTYGAFGPSAAAAGIIIAFLFF